MYKVTNTLIILKCLQTSIIPKIIHRCTHTNSIQFLCKQMHNKSINTSAKTNNKSLNCKSIKLPRITDAENYVINYFYLMILYIKIYAYKRRKLTAEIAAL